MCIRDSNHTVHITIVCVGLLANGCRLKQRINLSINELNTSTINTFYCLQEVMLRPVISKQGQISENASEKPHSLRLGFTYRNSESVRKKLDEEAGETEL